MLTLPQNVFVAQRMPTWWVEVADFGISKRYSDSTALYTLLSGDSNFAAPELAGFSDDPTVTASADVWSLGCLASWLLIYDVLIPSSKMFSFARDKFAVPLNRLTAEGASEQAADFVKMCLCYAPDRRQTAARLVTISLCSRLGFEQHQIFSDHRYGKREST